MSVRSWFGFPDAPARSVEASVTGVSPETWASLLTLAGLTQDQIPKVVSRSEALKIPALKSGVSILCGIAAQLPLVAEPSGESNTFLAELDPRVPRGWTVARTIDSLIFNGLSWWFVTSRTSRGFPRTIEWCDVSRVDVSNPEQPKLDQVPVSAGDLIRFDGIIDGILTAGSESISTALANVRQTRRYAENPQPHYYLTDPDGAEPLEPDDARKYLTALRDAVTSNGAAYLAGLKLNPVGWTASEIQLVEARQLDAVEMARLLAIPTRYLAAPEQGSSLTYANLGEVRRDLLEIGGLALYAAPIEQRLSMPDVTPRGTVVRFDAESFFLRVTPDQPTPTPPTDAPATPAPEVNP